MENETIQGEGLHGSTARAEKKRRRKWPYVLLTLALVFAIAMGFTYSKIRKYRPIATDLAAQFHKQLDAEQYDAIYSASAPGLQKGTNKEKFSKLLSAIHRKLGNVKQSSQGFIELNANANGAFLTVDFDTEFEKAKASERFVWKVTGDKRELLNYEISSNELVTD